MGENNSASRLITQNLLISAETALRSNYVDKSNIIDLSSLINLVVLHDNILILGGNNHNLSCEIVDWVSENINLNKDNVENPAIISLAKKHLTVYFGKEKSDRFNTVFELALNPEVSLYESYLYPEWDGSNEINLSLEELALLESQDDARIKLGQSPKLNLDLQFLMRTFLYMAYTDFSSIPFTPDNTRAPIVTKLIQKQEATLRGQLSEAIQKQFIEYPKIGGREIRSLTTPFATVVFQRSKGNRTKILEETIRLRDEMEKTRIRLSDLERKMLMFSRDESIAAESQWKKVIKEIERDFGVEPNLVSFKRGISFTKEIGEVMDDPKSWKAWLATLALLPVEVITRLYNRRPVFEIHSLRKQLPGINRLDSLIHELFGDLKK